MDSPQQIVVCENCNQREAWYNINWEGCTQHDVCGDCLKIFSAARCAAIFNDSNSPLLK